LDSSLLIDATLKADMPPLALPREQYMSRAKEIWEELDLPRLTPQPPWHGYELGDWSDLWSDYANRAVAGDWEQNGIMTAKRQRDGMKPETPTRDVET
jgi:4-hydroxy-3-polyprenylbenzoate decarboxylase